MKFNIKHVMTIYMLSIPATMLHANPQAANNPLLKTTPVTQTANNTTLMDVLRKKTIEIIESLITGGVTVNPQDKQNFITLMIATAQSNPELVKLLFAKSADIVELVKVLIAKSSDVMEITKLLIKSGAEINAKANASAAASKLPVNTESAKIAQPLKMA